MSTWGGGIHILRAELASDIQTGVLISDDLPVNSTLFHMSVVNFGTLGSEVPAWISLAPWEDTGYILYPGDWTPSCGSSPFQKSLFLPESLRDLNTQSCLEPKSLQRERRDPKPEPGALEKMTHCPPSFSLIHLFPLLTL